MENRLITPQQTDTRALINFVENHPKIMVVTGAGISSSSGIPTYRDELGCWKYQQPIQHQPFIDQLDQRQRYWSRSAIGWPAIAKAKPNPAHQALVKLETIGKINCLLTQNVDRLHQQAGHKNVIDLHGRLDHVICLGCGLIENRAAVQPRLINDNPFLEQLSGQSAPDGDADVAFNEIDTISCPTCQACGGILMPDVVFYGGSVPKARVESAMLALEAADALLVVGSSLMVYSSFRFCKAALQQHKPIAAINQGITRADELFQLKVEHDCAEVLTYVANNLAR
jgi:NAD-dependent SIR2 family protein deacetylase